MQSLKTECFLYIYSQNHTVHSWQSEAVKFLQFRKNQTFIKLLLRQKSMPRDLLKILKFFFYGHVFPAFVFSYTYHHLQHSRGEQKTHKLACRKYREYGAPTKLLTCMGLSHPEVTSPLTSTFTHAQRRVIN